MRDYTAIGPPTAITGFGGRCGGILRRMTSARPFVVLMALALSGCAPPGDPTTLDNRLIVETVEIDLIAACGRPSTSDRSGGKRIAPRLLGHVTLPDDPILVVDARVSRMSRDSLTEIEPVAFVVEVDGSEVWRRSTSLPNRHDVFRESVNLSGFADRTTSVELRIERPDSEAVKAYWFQATINQQRFVDRQPISNGHNVLVVVVDTLRADHCSLYGYDRDTTPNLDRFSAQGAVFDAALSPASWTLPSIASMLTGEYPPGHGAADGQAMTHHDELLAETLLADGVTTYAGSANPLIGPIHGFAQGIETFDHEPWAPAETISDGFLNWLPTVSEHRWFAYLHYIDPHDPYDAPLPAENRFADASYTGTFLNDDALNTHAAAVNHGNPSTMNVTDEDVQWLIDRYDEEILYWDHHFGRVVEALRSSGLLENTIVIVTSDHGEEFGEHGMFKHGQQLFDETVHVPLVVAGPGISASRNWSVTENRLMYFTVLDAFGLLDRNQSGLSLFAPRSVPGRGYLYTRYTLRADDPRNRRGLAALRTDHYKLISETDIDGVALFDLTRDPAEARDVAGIDTVVTETMGQELNSWLATTRGNRRTEANEPVSDATVEQLRALGYVQ
jgi:arylsulfatase A-like enzyme